MELKSEGENYTSNEIIMILMVPLAMLLILAMAIKCKRKLGARKYSDYSNETVAEALAAVKKGISIRQTAKNYGIPKSTLSRKHRNVNPKAYGSPTALSSIESNYLIEGLLKYAKWVCPLTYVNIRKIVQVYLNEKGKTEK